MTRSTGDGRLQHLYSELQPQLARILNSNLGAPAWIVDDACQSAWRALLERGGSIDPGGELGWLSTTATRVALRMMRRERIAETCMELPVPIRLDDFRLRQPNPEHSLELRERLAEIRQLPVRQQRIVMLHGFGYEYDEIAAATGETRRSVARQLTRARQRLRLADGR